MKRTALALTLTLALPLVNFGCDATKSAASDDKPAAKAKKDDAPKAKAPTEAPAAAKPAAPKAEPKPAAPDKGVVVLEEVEGLGKVKMPKGYESSHDKGWKYDLGDYKSITVSWEPHGVKNLAKAKSMSKILANAQSSRSRPFPWSIS